MAAIRCPQCGTEIADPSAKFCPNPDCGYPLSFAKPEPDEPEPAMERRPLEKVEPVTPPVPDPAPPVTPPVPPPVAPPVPPASSSGPNPGLLIAAAVAVVVVIGLVVAFAGGAGDEEAATSAPEERETRAGGGGGGEATAEPAESVLAFTRVPPDEAVFGGDFDQRMHRVAAGDEELVAVGSEGLEGSFDAVVWTSSDGATWQRVPADPADVGGVGDQEMNAIARTSEGYVIVGYDESQDEGDAAVWLFDGAVVTRVDPAQSALLGDGRQDMTRVVAVGEQLVAVGIDGANDPAAPDAGVWQSFGGASWARVASDHLGGDGFQYMRTITPFEDGFVGGGEEEHEDGDLDAAVWKSKGTSFDRVLGTEATFGGDGMQRIFSVIAAGSDVVAVGAAAGADPIDASVWVSEDGIAWERIQDAETFGGPHRQTMFGAIVAGDLLVTVGFDGAAGEGDDAAVWETRDARTWSRSTVEAAGGPGEQRMKGVTVFEGKVIAVGWDASGGDRDAAVWTSPLPE